MYKASRALAALDNRKQVSPEDVKKAAELVLPHRRRRKPFEQPGLDQERLDDLMEQASQPSSSPENESNTEQSKSDQSSPDQPNSNQSVLEPEDQQQKTDQPSDEQTQIFAATAPDSVRHISVDTPSLFNAAGRRSTTITTERGHTVRTVADENPSNLAVGATLRSAVLRNPTKFQVIPSDLHQQIRESKSANLILLVVDASGSMAAQRRMEAVKGAVLALLTDTYQRRDQVAVISFRGAQATILLTPTRSVDLAEQRMRELSTGGRTPLPHALQLTLEILGKNTGANSLQPLLVLLSDGKANVALDVDGDPWNETLTLAGLLSEHGTPALVIDTETGFLRLGRAAQLAKALAGECLSLEELTAESLTLTIRGSIKTT
jgi:magnesium chelatase subunit D